LINVDTTNTTPLMRAAPAITLFTRNDSFTLR
jgi:hypothetical protein